MVPDIISLGKRLSHDESLHCLEPDTSIGGREAAIDRRFIWYINRDTWFTMRRRLNVWEKGF